MQEDNLLIGEVLSGSPSALEVLVKKYYRIIFSYIYRNLGDYHAAYDLTQDVFIKMLKSLGLFDKEKGDFGHWILKIAVNTCKDFYKSSYYNRVVKNTTDIEQCLYTSTNVTDFLEHRENTQAVKSAVKKLPQYQREAIILRFFHDMKIAEISKMTQTNEATVKSRIRQGLGKLKAILMEGDDCYGKKQLHK